MKNNIIIFKKVGKTVLGFGVAEDTINTDISAHVKNCTTTE